MRNRNRFARAMSALAIATFTTAPMPALAHGPQPVDTATPIQHIVVIFQENVSFDHYFATYPVAQNPSGEPQFSAAEQTPDVNGLSGILLSGNSNAANSANGANAINPFRLDRSQASTCDQDHNYGAEQTAFDMGLMDAFPLSTGTGASSYCAAQYAYGKDKGVVMGYFDGNTVTAIWNYAQRYAMSDNSYGTTFGPSTPGALNLVAGNTYPATTSATSPKLVNVSAGQGTLVGDLDPTGDVCSNGTTVALGGSSIGDLLNAQGVTWGAFMGGFDLTIKNPDGSTGCNRQSPATPANGGPTQDYIPHHAWFQYFASTANPTHARPTVPPSLYGTSADTVTNHQYDVHDFFDALGAGNLPAVSFIKAPAWGDGHAGYSDPLLEQMFLVDTINAIQNSPFWGNTAIVISYDDSDGWYDHQMSPIVNSSAVLNPVNNAQYGDNLNGAGKCGNGSPLGGIEGRCGYGPRLPMIVISPYANRNFVDHTLTDQSSIIRFVEDNWSLGRIGNGSTDAIAGTLNNLFNFSAPNQGEDDRLILDPATGLVAHGDRGGRSH